MKELIVKDLINEKKIGPYLVGVVDDFSNLLCETYSNFDMDDIDRELLIEVYEKRLPHLIKTGVIHGGFSETIECLKQYSHKIYVYSFNIGNVFFQVILNQDKSEIIGLIYVIKND